MALDDPLSFCHRRTVKSVRATSLQNDAAQGHRPSTSSALLQKAAALSLAESPQRCVVLRNFDGYPWENFDGNNGKVYMHLHAGPLSKPPTAPLGSPQHIRSQPQAGQRRTASQAQQLRQPRAPMAPHQSSRRVVAVQQLQQTRNKVRASTLRRSHSCGKEGPPGGSGTGQGWRSRWCGWIWR